MLKTLISVTVAATLGFSHFASISVAHAQDINLPNLGTVAGADLSLRDEREYGEEIMRHIRADDTYMADEETIDYLNRLGYRLVAAGETQPYNFFFFPIRDKSLNAFALPGGFIAVHSGLMVAAVSESELAGVIGHEIGHVTQRHIARMIEQSQGSMAMTIGSLLLAILAARAGGNSGGNAAMAIAMGTQAAMIQKQLAYSRDAEREADRVGLMTLANAGFDPFGMESFFEKLRQNNRFYESTSLAYLSTHPLTNERMSDMQNRTRKLTRVHHVDSLDFKLIQARMRVLQETRYDGWLSCTRTIGENLSRLKGDAATAAHYGLSIAYHKINQPQKALEHAKKSVESTRAKSVILDKNLSEISFSQAKTASQRTAALELAKSAAKQYPYSTMAASNYANLLFKAKRNDEVIRFLRNQRALSRHHQDYYALLARSYEALGKKSLAYCATGDMYLLAGNKKAALYQFDLAQKAGDADFYAMSEIDAKLRQVRAQLQDPNKKR